MSLTDPSEGKSVEPAQPMLPLMETVSELWPSTSEVQLGRGRTGPRPGTQGQDREEFLIVPHSRAPRILLPARIAHAASNSMRRYSAAISLRETLQRLGLAAALDAGAARALLPDRVYVEHGDGGSIVSYLSEVLSTPVCVSVTIGPARANRKPVLQVFDPRGRSLAFAKIGNNVVAAGHVEREAASLRTLGTREFTTLRVPDLLHFGRWNEMLVLVMSALDSGPLAGRLGFERVRTRGLAELSTSFSQGSAPLRETPLWSRIHEMCGLLGDEKSRSRMADCIDAIDRQFGDRTVGIRAWHGDCTPWNMARHRNRLHLWDWEQFDQGVPGGMDIIHYAVNRRTKLEGLSIEAIFAGLGDAAPGFLDPETLDATTAAAYLASITMRYLRGVEGPGALSENVRPQSQTFLSALEQLTTSR